MKVLALTSLGAILSSTPFTAFGSLPPPIVYTIAGSDSGGGAGIQADLHAIHAMKCHACSAITCLTAQNSCGVTGVHAPPASFLRTQLQTLLQDLPPRAVKIGMLGTSELAETVGAFLKEISSLRPRPWVVLDPVMISTSGHKLIDDEAKQAMIDQIFPYTDILTPNKYEAEALLGRELSTPQSVEQGARDLLAMGVQSVLIKGGHILDRDGKDSHAADMNATLGYAHDYFLSSVPHTGEERLCDGARGVWLSTARYDSKHTHGTGCTLSSAIASALALGHQRRQVVESTGKHMEGATSAIYPVDACCLAKAYVTAGIAHGQALGKGPGPVAHTVFPASSRYYPTIAVSPYSPKAPAFRRINFRDRTNTDAPTLGRILPIVDTVDWVARLTTTPGITDIQLRIKDETDPDRILERVKLCQKMCHDANIRLWINDHWQAAIIAKCFGVHVGQEDLTKCIDAGGLDQMIQHNLALGISTHSYGELAAALGVNPSYVSLGPVFGTLSKRVAFDPQGLATVAKWRQLIPSHVPLVTIGGIVDAETARQNKEAGADCVAVISAVTQSEDVTTSVRQLNDAMSE